MEGLIQPSRSIALSSLAPREWSHGKGDEDALLDEEVGVRMRRGSLTQVPYIRDVGSATQDAILISDRQRGPTEHEAEATSAVYLLNA